MEKSHRILKEYAKFLEHHQVFYRALQAQNKRSYNGK